VRSRRIPMWSAALAALAILSLGSTAVAGPRLTVRDSTGKYKYKPTTLKFKFPALAPPFKITKLRHWVGWGTARPTTKGWLHYDNCKPNCAEGHYKRKRATVRLFAPRHCHGRRVFGAVYVRPRHLRNHFHRIGCSGVLRN
jgi:hypothetical protein